MERKVFQLLYLSLFKKKKNHKPSLPEIIFTVWPASALLWDQWKAARLIGFHLLIDCRCQRRFVPPCSMGSRDYLVLFFFFCQMQEIRNPGAQPHHRYPRLLLHMLPSYRKAWLEQRSILAVQPSNCLWKPNLHEVQQRFPFWFQQLKHIGFAPYKPLEVGTQF